MYDGILLVVSFSLEVYENENNYYEQLLLHLPTEVELCGVIKFGNCFSTEDGFKGILQVSIIIVPYLIHVDPAAFPY